MELITVLDDILSRCENVEGILAIDGFFINDYTVEDFDALLKTISNTPMIIGLVFLETKNGIITKMFEESSTAYDVITKINKMRNFKLLYNCIIPHDFEQYEKLKQIEQMDSLLKNSNLNLTIFLHRVVLLVQIALIRNKMVVYFQHDHCKAVYDDGKFAMEYVRHKKKL